MKNVPENSLQTSLSWLHFKTGQAVKKTWSKSLKSSFLAKSFSFSTKRLSILLNFPFLSASSNSTRLILLREKGSLRSHGRWFAFMNKISSCISYSVNIMTSCPRHLAVGWRVPRVSRHTRLETEPCRRPERSLSFLSYISMP